MGEAISVLSKLAAQCLREMVSLTHSFLAIIYDSSELREMLLCQRDFQERGPPHWGMMWPDIEKNVYNVSSVSSGTEFLIRLTHQA